jgi:hypothetical protein
MVGAAHYGLPVGRRLQDTRNKDKNIYTRKILRNWHEYRLPKPAFLSSDEGAKATCLICLIPFVVAPDLMKIVAFNHDASAWGHANGGEGPGALHITFLPGAGDLLHISSPHDLQATFRTEFIAQEFRRLGIHVTFAEDDQVSRIPARRPPAEDPSIQRDDDEGEEEADSLPQNPDWWD